MKHAADAGRDAGDRAATQRTTTSSDASIIRQRFGETHAHGSAERRREPNKESAQGSSGQACRCKDRRQCRDRAIHQSQETRLNLLQHDGAICQRLIFLRHRASPGRLGLQVPDQADERCGSRQTHRQQEDVDQNIPAPHGSPVDGDLVLEKLGEARFGCFQRGSSITMDAASRNSVKNMTKKPVMTAK